MMLSQNASLALVRSSISGNLLFIKFQINNNEQYFYYMKINHGTNEFDWFLHNKKASSRKIECSLKMHKNALLERFIWLSLSEKKIILDL